MTTISINLADPPDWVSRALWTFAQTFVTLEIAAGADWLSVASIKLAGLGAIALALSVAKTGALAWWSARKAAQVAARTAAAFEAEQPADK